MDCDALGDDQWERIKGFVPGGTRGKRGPRTNNRLFLDALLWMARSGGRWRDLPERLGDYRSVKRRYYRWIEMGVLDEMLAVLSREADLEWLMIDSTIVRAHHHAAGARQSKGGACPGPGSVSRRIDDENPRSNRSARSSPPSDRQSWTMQRYRFRSRSYQRDKSSCPAGRQGLRCRPSVRQDRRCRNRGRHPAQTQSQGSASV